MKAIVSLFISAYQPGMASIECRANSLTQSHRTLFRDDQYGDESSEAGVYKDKGYKDKADEDKGYEGKHFEDQRFEEPDFEGARCENLLFEDTHFENPNYEDICWMISRARRRQPLGYYVMYLRYVNHHSGYARTVATSLLQHIALHPTLKESLSTSLIAYLQQHEDLFCQTLHQQLIEFHTSR
ncbi:hypothetical protein [Vibrio splendidus]|uniref:Uncharacterized protein n=1 Tax=Vibrio splendidus TaxID=29497 RepID=A0A2T5E6U5_VIBSP|nr:hypothetical protein [Vibrio splendidus]OEE51113.1 hypothetical protein A147_07180 [Vibrio splendidus FF-6]PTP15046.1 hypothetical protein CWO36_20280 [Vibrio splendidus]